MSSRNEEKLRRELEILKAQLKSQTSQKPISKTQPLMQDEAAKNSISMASTKTQSKNLELNYQSIKSELNKTILFSFFTLTALLLLYFTEFKWLPLLKFF